MKKIIVPLLCILFLLTSCSAGTDNLKSYWNYREYLQEAAMNRHWDILFTISLKLMMRVLGELCRFICCEACILK